MVKLPVFLGVYGSDASPEGSQLTSYFEVTDCRNLHLREVCCAQVLISLGIARQIRLLIKKNGCQRKPAATGRQGDFGPPSIQSARGICECCPALPAAPAHARQPSRRKAWATCLGRCSGGRVARDPAFGILIAGNARRGSGVPRGGGGTVVRGGASPVGDGAAGVDAVGARPRAAQSQYQEQRDNQAPHVPLYRSRRQITLRRRLAIHLMNGWGRTAAGKGRDESRLGRLDSLRHDLSEQYCRFR